MMKKIFAVGIIALAGTACAVETVSYDASIALRQTNWSDSLVFPKFDPSLGILKKVIFQIDGHVEGNVQFESLDAAGTTITSFLQAEITLFRPDNTVLAVVIPVLMNSDPATAFDGGTDFAGTSGKSYLGLSVDKSEMDMTSSLVDFALFTAALPGDTISLPVDAQGTSGGTGAGNLLLLTRTDAAARFIVTYEYNLIPTPSSLGLLGLAGLVVGRRRR